MSNKKRGDIKPLLVVSIEKTLIIMDRQGPKKYRWTSTLIFLFFSSCRKPRGRNIMHTSILAKAKVLCLFSFTPSPLLLPKHRIAINVCKRISI